MVLLRWCAGAVGAGSVPGGAVGGARFGVLRLGEGRVPSRDYVGRGKVPVAGESMVPLPFTDIIYKKIKKTKKLTAVRCVLFGSVSSFASTTALASSIEGACEMPPYLSALVYIYPHTFPRSKNLSLSYERAFGACAANLEMHIATQLKICEANQDTAEHSKTLHVLTRAQRTRVHLCPRHWLLYHLGLY
jgi:hypothetical protein